MFTHMVPFTTKTKGMALGGAVALGWLLVSGAWAQDEEATEAGAPAAEESPAPAETVAESADEGAGPTADGDTSGEQTEAEESEELAPIVLDRHVELEDDVYLEPSEMRPMVAGDSDPETPEQRLQRLFTMYRDAVADRNYGEADVLGKQIVETTIGIFGLDSHESAKALTNLAIAQHGIADYESAILNYNSAIGIIERVDDMLSPGLINPLRGLGAAQLASGRPDLARDAFDRAVHISHVNEGPHNLDQIEILESLSETYLSVGEFEDAADVQKRIFYLQARNVDDRSLDIIPALRTRAEWQRRMHLYDQERFTWRRIISIIEDEKGNESLELVEPLTELGKSYLFVGYSDVPFVDTSSTASGEIYLKRAVRITERNEAATWLDQTKAMLELADFYLMTGRPNRGHRIYGDVWELLSADESRLAARAEELEQTVLLQEVYPPRMYGGDPAVPLLEAPPGYETGSVTYEYTVTTRGTPRDVVIVQADPVGLDSMYETVARDVRRMIYRPRIVGGQPVDTSNVSFSHSFYYREADLPNAPAPQEEEMITDNSPSA